MKIFIKLFLVLAFCVMSCSAFAAVETKEDLNKKIQAVESLYKKDFTTMYQKNAVFGITADKFDMTTQHYKNNVSSALRKLTFIQKELNNIDANKNFTKEQKVMEEQSKLQDADDVLFELENKTFNYIESLMFILPSLTYQQYTKKFKEYYNQLNLLK